MVRKKSKQGAHLKGASTSRFNGENKSSRDWLDAEDGTVKAPDPGKTRELLQGLYLFALTWGVGATVTDDGRAKFDVFLRQLLKKEVPDILSTPGAPQPVFPALKLTKGLPDKGTAFDYVFSVERNSWLGWMSTVGTYTVPPGSAFNEIFVQTIDTVQYGYIADILMTHGVPILMSGNTGTGKTILCRDRILKGLDGDKYKSIFLNFSAQTKCDAAHNIIDLALDKRRKGVFGPPFGKKCVIFVDDLNMPQLETYGAQPPVELLRQFMDHNGWYDLKDCTFRELTDIQFVAAMGPPGGGRNPVTPRYLRHFNLTWCTDYSPASLERIFSTILAWHLESFVGEVKTSCSSIVNATIEIYTTICAELLPTPSKSHYTFNLRDIAKVVQGTMQSTPKSVASSKDIVRLWAHESLRVFADRLVEQKDTDWFYALLFKQLQGKFNTTWKDITETDERRLIYGDFMKEGSSEYEVLANMEELIAKTQGMLEDFNAISKRPMELIIFPFAVEHVCRILRIIKQPFGNALLVGMGGSGRQSLTTLAAHMAQFEIFSIELTKSYDRSAWKEDLKSLLRLAGEQVKATVFLFSDTQVKEEAMIEDINNILNAGEVPNLFPQDEVAQVCDGLGPKAKELNLQDTSLPSLWRLFVKQCRANLHVVLCMSPIGDAFRTRLRKFPSLVNCCTIDWFTEWPADALLTVAESFMADIKMEADVRKAVLKMCCYFQDSVSKISKDYFSEARRYNYVTPTSYLELLGAFRSLLVVKRDEISAAKSRYDVGLDKLQSTADQVAGMQAELQALQPKLVVARREADELMVVIERDSAEAQITKDVVEKDEAAATIKANEANQIKEECRPVSPRPSPRWRPRSRPSPRSKSRTSTRSSR